MNEYEGNRLQDRALEPCYEGEKELRTVLDADKDLKKDKGEAINWDAAINIHHGGKWKIPATRGCQVIRHWENYLDFIETLEKDSTIKGTQSNELTGPRAGGNRPVVYTLVTGEFLRSVARNDWQPASEAPSSNGTSSEESASEGWTGQRTRIPFPFASLRETTGPAFFPKASHLGYDLLR